MDAHQIHPSPASARRRFVQRGPHGRAVTSPAAAGTRKAELARALLLLAAIVVSPPGSAGAIHDAAKAGDLEAVQRLMIGGADVNDRGVNDETPLIIAALEGQEEIVAYLLQRGADVAARNAAGLSSLHAAAYGGHVDIVALLLAKGAKINDADNRFGVLPLHVAAEENHPAVVELLLKHGADVTAVEVNGYSALSRAGFREHWDVVNILLTSGAQCQAAEKVGEWLHQECSSRAAAL